LLIQIKELEVGSGLPDGICIFKPENPHLCKL
jgi:hypothetical protein